MRNHSMLNRKTSSLLALLLVCSLLFSACGSDAYTTYASAYNKLWANRGINANITGTLQMDGESTRYIGNFQVDNTKNQIYYEMETVDGKTIQFSDGSYLYTQQGDMKTKHSLSGTGEQSRSAREPENKEAPEFDTSKFLDEFSSMFEASKIKELGLFDPIDKAAVTKTTKNGDVYTLEVADALVKKYVNTLATTQAGTSDTVQVSEMKNFKYTATIKNGVVTATTYAGDVTVKVPASLMSNGEAKEYQVNLDIQIEFVNPGEAVSISLPSTEGFEEIK